MHSFAANPQINAGIFGRKPGGCILDGLFCKFFTDQGLKSGFRNTNFAECRVAIFVPRDIVCAISNGHDQKRINVFTQVVPFRLLFAGGPCNPVEAVL